MLKVGLTGGIGSGKTTVANLFSSLGAPIIDADEIAHAIAQPGMPVLVKIRAKFGDQILDNDGELNRPLLKKIIFSESNKKQQLETIMHPVIFAEIQRRLKTLDAAYVILCIPLLVETGRENFVDRILVVDCTQALQILRVQKRDRLSIDVIKSIIRAQVPRSQRNRMANDIIENTGDTLQLAEQVKKLHNSYISISKAETGNIVCE